MHENTGKLWLAVSDDALRAKLIALLTDAGFEVLTDPGEGLNPFPNFDPDVAILASDPSQFDCCDLLSEIKSSKHTHNTRVVILSPGGSAERIRSLDLGADDVLSLPFDPHELLSRVRSQLRSKFIADEFRERSQFVVDERSATQQVVTAVNEERRTLHIWGVATVIVLIVVGLIVVSFDRRSQQQNVRVYAAITRLQTGLLTQQQLIEPWWQSSEFKEMLEQGLEPEISEMTAYFPNVTHGIAITTQKISSNADIALVKGEVSGLGLKELALGSVLHAAIGDSPVVLLGYPTGVNAILARTGTEALQSIAASTKGDPKQVMEELARRHLIEPVVTQGHIGSVHPDKIIYDAQTTSGGSGGPLFNDQGKVIGVNFAMVRDFGGSNFAIPISYGESLLKP